MFAGAHLPGEPGGTPARSRGLTLLAHSWTLPTKRGALPFSRSWSCMFDLRKCRGAIRALHRVVVTALTWAGVVVAIVIGAMVAGLVAGVLGASQNTAGWIALASLVAPPLGAGAWVAFRRRTATRLSQTRISARQRFSDVWTRMRDSHALPEVRIACTYLSFTLGAAVGASLVAGAFGASLVVRTLAVLFGAGPIVAIYLSRHRSHHSAYRLATTTLSALSLTAALIASTSPSSSSAPAKLHPRVPTTAKPSIAAQLLDIANKAKAAGLVSDDGNRPYVTIHNLFAVGSLSYLFVLTQAPDADLGAGPTPSDEIRIYDDVRGRPRLAFRFRPKTPVYDSPRCDRRTGVNCQEAPIRFTYLRTLEPDRNGEATVVGTFNIDKDTGEGGLEFPVSISTGTTGPVDYQITPIIADRQRIVTTPSVPRSSTVGSLFSTGRRNEDINVLRPHYALRTLTLSLENDLLPTQSEIRTPLVLRDVYSKTIVAAYGASGVWLPPGPSDDVMLMSYLAGIVITGDVLAPVRTLLGRIKSLEVEAFWAKRHVRPARRLKEVMTALTREAKATAAQLRPDLGRLNAARAREYVDVRGVQLGYDSLGVCEGNWFFAYRFRAGDVVGSTLSQPLFNRQPAGSPFATVWRKYSGTICA